MFFRTGVYLKKFKALQAAEGGSADMIKNSGNSFLKSWYERASQCPSFEKRGSLTVEAALVFPIFLFAMTAFLYLFLLVQLRTEVGRALSDTGRELSQAAHFSGEAGGLASSAAAVFYGQSSVRTYLEGRAAAGILKGGKEGITFLGTVWDEKSSVLTLRASYQVVLPPGLSWFRPVRVTQKRKVRGFTGFGGRAEGEDSFKEEIVYVTDYGTVYHRELSCRHLNLSVSQREFSEVGTLRNEDGGRYYPCERCWKDGSSLVYLTGAGTRYHQDLGCPSLIRGIRTLLYSEVGALPPCSLCGR